MRYTITRQFDVTDEQPELWTVAAAHDYLEQAVAWLIREGRIPHMTNAYQDMGDECAIAVIELSDRDTALMLKLAL